MKNEAINQSIKALPAVSGAAYAANDLSYAELAAIATIGYVVLQALYLIWKWNNERKDRKNA